MKSIFQLIANPVLKVFNCYGYEYLIVITSVNAKKIKIAYAEKGH